MVVRVVVALDDRWGSCSVTRNQKTTTFRFFCKKPPLLFLHQTTVSNTLVYETSAHFWLVLEYCVGGDLKGLLEQDKKLPKSAMHDLAYDLVKALLFLHSQGIIYCDLKPSNILLDEFGCMKLCDFGLARRLNDIEKIDPGDVPQPMRGTPCYMAPELFQEAGDSSYASDFWALGCVLYECYVGRPPFVGREFTPLVKSILSEPAPPLPDNSSRSFQNLINCLLMKDPAERLQWSELCARNFWRNSMPMIPLPPQPAFDNMVGFPTTPYLAERNGDKPSRHLTPPKAREHLRKNDENSARCSQPLLRIMSRIAKKNLQRVKDKENYRRPPTETDENEAEVKIGNDDMELDFGENPEGDAPDDNDGSDNAGSTADEMHTTEGTDGNEENCINQVDMLTDKCSVKPDTMKARPKIPSAAATGSEPSNIFEAFWHPTDLAVKPTVTVLPFEALPAADYIRLPREQMNAFHSQIIQSLSGSFQVASLMGLLIRYSTILDAELASSGIVNALSDGLRDQHDKLRRFCMATLGELLSVIALVSPILRKGEDDLAQLYALQTIDNICSQGTDWTSRFDSRDVIGHLCYIYKATGKQENTRLIAISCLSRLARFSSELTLRRKALLFVALLCKNTVDRLGKEKDGFIHQCTEAFVQLVALLVPGILDTVSSDIQQVMGGKRAHPRSTIHLFRVILHLLGSVSFNHRVVTSQVLLQLANLMKILETPFKARDDFQMTLLRVLDAATLEPSVILREHKIFTSRFLPSLSIFYKGNKDCDARFLCLKILSDVMIVIFSDSSLTADEQCLADLKTISHKYFLPMYPSFAEDEDPIPMYAQKLLVMLMEHDSTVSQCFEFLLGDLTNANVSNVKLCFALASSPDMDSNILSQLQVVRRIGNLLEFATAKDMDDFLEPTLELCRAFIICGIGSNRSIVLTKEPALLVDGAFSMSIAVDQQSYIVDICDLGGSMDCVVLLLKAAPREATMGLLTNLPKLSALLDSLKHGAPLPLTRLLYSLAFSCRQYLTQGMILPISVPALMRVEALVSSLADAASCVGAELQCLPRQRCGEGAGQLAAIT
ncbi:hypothetical protein VPH35_038514 [Triticum aestivum]